MKIKRGLKIFSLLLCLLTVILLYIISSQSGLQIAFWVTAKVIPGSLQINKLTGSLLKTIQLTDLEYSKKNTYFYTHKLNLHWQPLALLVGKIEFKNLTLDQVKIILPKQENVSVLSPPQKFTIPTLTLPLNIILKNIEVNDVDFKQGDHNDFYIRNIKLQALTKNNTLFIDKFSITSPRYSASFKGSVHFEMPFNTVLTINVVNHFPGYRDICSTINLKGDLKNNLSLNATVNSPFRASLVGSLEAKQGAISLVGNWENLFIPLHSNVTSKNGNLTIKGSLKNYNLDLKSDISGKALPSGKWEIEGNGNLTGLKLKKITAHTLQGLIQGNILLAFSPFISWQSQFQVSHINPGVKWSQWLGDVNLKLQIKGSLNKNNPKIDFLLDGLSGTLQNHKLSGYVNFSYKKHALEIAKSFLYVGDDIITLRGELAKHWNLNWKINIPDLSETLPEATGNIYSKGNITGKLHLPKIDAVLNITSLLFKNLAIKKLDLTAKANFASVSTTQAKIKILTKDFSFKQYHLDQADISSTGTLTKNNLQATIEENGSSLFFHFIGSYLNNTYNGSLKTLLLKTKAQSLWNLAHSVSVKLSPSVVNIAPFLWKTKASSISGAVNWQKENPSKISVNFNNISSEILRNWLPDNTKIDTKINLDAEFNTDKNNHMYGHLNLETSPIKIAYKNFSPARFATIKMTSKLTDSFVLAQLKIIEENQLLSDANLQLNFLGDRQTLEKHQPIKGEIKLTFDQLTLLPLFITQIDNVKGMLKTNLKLSGSMDKPQLDGTLEVKDFSANITPLETKLEDLNFQANADSKTKKITFKGHAKTGEGNFTIDGQTVQNLLFFPTSLKIKGENILLINTDEYKVFASPLLQITYSRPKMTVSGNIDIPKANITPKDFTTTVTLPEDIFVVKNGVADFEYPWFELYSNIKINLGDDIKLELAGMSAKVSGKLQIKTAPRELTTAIGELHLLEGQYDAYGEKLVIKNGSLIFTNSPLTNPGLNIEAIKALKDLSDSTKNLTTSTASVSLKNLIAGLHITGTIKRPILKLFSEPAGLNDSDILSYLIFGTPSNKISEAKAQILLKAAQSLGMGGDSHIISNLQKTFGLSDFGLESNAITNPETKTTEKNTSFVIGKYITPRLYLNYSIGLIVPVNILQTRYTIAKNWFARTETSKIGNGADIFYIIQTD